MALCGFYSHKSYPLHLRRIRFKDIERYALRAPLTNPGFVIGAVVLAAGHLCS